jgi:hypothetical protein
MPRPKLLICLALLLAACDPSSDESSSSGKGTQEEPGASSATLPTTDYDVAQALAQKGRECGAIGEGYWSWEILSPGYFCTTRCLLSESCGSFERALCDGEERGALSRCFDRCEEIEDDVAQCGDGTTVPVEAMCDFRQDCATGEDEAHCERFTCGDGRKILVWSRCNGPEDCADGSDEEGCAELCGEPRAMAQP